MSATPRRPRTVLALAACTLASACSNLTGNACTAEYVYGVNVEVVDALSGEGIAEGATLTIRDGPYIELVTETLDGIVLSGAGERPGHYELGVTRSGYQPWSLTGVIVVRGECHVSPATARAELDPM